MKINPFILVTRSGEEGRELCRMLASGGCRAEHFAPVTLAGPEDRERCRRQLLSALPCDHLIAPSAEALRQAAALAGIEQLARLSLIVPGEGTARVARALGFRHINHPPLGGTSEDILRLPVLEAVRDQRVVVLAAAGGRPEIGRELSRRGAVVERLHVYRRLRQPIPPVLEDQLLQCPDPITLLASGGALAALKETLAQETWEHLIVGLMIAPSARVADLARAAGGMKVEAANGADHESMLRALVRSRSDMKDCVTLGSGSGNDHHE
ncbi:MAG: uroporphyrinogen-III synthase [Wenzhouxiangella sp.]|jgi:uroporphyrinogen-III synthase|nr:uroporphyrinogen-III synthase [Wenzhouxiangella sp.]